LSQQKEARFTASNAAFVHIEACALNKSDIRSLDFVSNRFFYETIQDL